MHDGDVFFVYLSVHTNHFQNQWTDFDQTSIICTSRQMLLGWSNQGGWDGWGI